MDGGSGAGLNAMGMVLDYVKIFEGWDREDAAFDEKQRREDRAFGQVYSQAEALGAASGVQSNSESLVNYLGGMKDEFQRLQEWDNQVFHAVRADEQMQFAFKYLNDFNSMLSMASGGAGGGGASGGGGAAGGGFGGFMGGFGG